jgi:hypothetical protein
VRRGPRGYPTRRLEQIRGAEAARIACQSRKFLDRPIRRLYIRRRLRAAASNQDPSGECRLKEHPVRKTAFLSIAIGLVSFTVLSGGRTTVAADDATSEKNEKTIDVPAKALKKFVGRYELAPGLLFTVEAVDGKLMVGLTGQPSYQVFPRSETVWFYKVVDATITFDVDKNGKCDSLDLFQNGSKQTAKRTTAPAEAPEKNEKTIEVPAKVLKKYVGRYELAPDVLFTVEAVDDKLMVGLTGQASYQVFPRSNTVWFYKVVDATITFHVDKNGKCDSLVLFQNGVKQRAKRKR